ncbi:DMT family transporter [Metabacillus arenae]|uniref:Multidrug efflux SMR transporter n=1 Tax=Metabacillus arenae TaxID=2771434 RepID=A0A926NAS1_9BACI|nr:multidrug efflux SMR transporter [Metabacillus arenae]MBD1380752.1 multidrug efflux SMR transporter [Metabacillus arenae]
MNWIFLIAAGLFEVVGVTAMNRIHRDKSLSSYLLLAGGFGLSFLFLSLAMLGISMGTAYSIWTGIGTVGSTLLGIFVYGEAKDWRRILFISMIIAATVGLKLIS